MVFKEVEEKSTFDPSLLQKYRFPGIFSIHVKTLPNLGYFMMSSVMWKLML